MAQATQVTTLEDIKEALSRDEFYGQVAVKIVVPEGYEGPSTVDGIPVVISKQASQPYIEPEEGGRLGFNGIEIK